ncbi:MAG: DUF4382 domain-containing protein [Oligoflexia bacterium]|nr:DUF4382 domain-containing protein [Oligoflexia bacterium]
MYKRKYNNRLVLIARMFGLISAIGFAVACNSGSNNGGSLASGDKAYAYTPSTLRITLTDKPLDDASSVNINIKHVELFVQKGSLQGRLIIAENLGFVDLLKLRNGILKAMGDLKLPDGVTFHQMRLVLADGNNVVMNNGSVCQMKTPSAQTSGVKILFNPAFTTEAGYSYAITLDFDADDSVVLQGNGGCLLKPVIKVKSATRAPIPPPATLPTPEVSYPDTTQEQPLPTTGTSDGTYTDNQTPQDPVIIVPEDLFNAP